MTLGSEIKKVSATADKLKGRAGNEANTKALLIEPILAGLGWDITDPEQVVREWRVYDGTSLDYALMVGDKPGLYLEAKAVSKNLDDKQFIAQAINYANNDGVLWCVLTNGLTWRVYKTNELVPMEEKLLVEVDLAKVAEDSTADATKALHLLGRESISEGGLDLWGERVFTDTRVRKALSELAVDPPASFLAFIVGAMGKPEVAQDRLRESVARVFGSQAGAASEQKPPPTKAPSKTVTSVGPVGGKQEYPLAHHLDSKPASILDLFEQVDDYVRSLGPNVTRRVRKQYLGYFRGKKSFSTVEVQRQRLILYLSLDPTTLQDIWVSDVMRDVTNIGHFGMGNTEYSLVGLEQVEAARKLLKLAHEQA